MGKSSKYSGSHEIQNRREEFTGGSDRNFGLVFAAVFGLIGGWGFILGSHHWPWWLGGSVAFGLLAWLAPVILSPLNKIWTKFGLLLFHIVSSIALGIIFYLCIMPIGIVIKLMGKDVLRLRLEPDAQSYWIERKPPGPDRDSFPRQF